MYAVLYFKKPSDVGIIFRVLTCEAICAKNLLGAKMMRGHASQGTTVTQYEVHNVSIISDKDLPDFHPEMFERFESFEDFVKTTRKGVRLTSHL